MEVQNLVLSSFTGFCLALLLIPFFIRLANRKGLFDLPDERKFHTQLVSPLGGIALFIGCWMPAYCLIDPAEWSNFIGLFTASLILFLVGLKDDLFKAHAITRLVCQISIASVLFFLGIQMQLSVLLPTIESSLIVDYFLTVVFVVSAINAYNFIDGIDGLAGGLGLIGSLAFGVLFYLNGDINMSLLAFSLAGPLIAFLIFNFDGANIFMGDNGSTVIGLMMACFCMIHMNLPEEALYTSPAIPLSIVSIPILDLIKVASVRIWHRRSPFRADRTHLHHRLLQLGINVPSICYILYGFNLFLLAGVWYLQATHYLTALSFLLICGLSSYFILGFLSMHVRKIDKLNRVA